MIKISLASQKYEVHFARYDFSYNLVGNHPVNKLEKEHKYSYCLEIYTICVEIDILVRIH